VKYVTIPVSDEMYDELLDGYKVGTGIVTITLEETGFEGATHDLVVTCLPYQEHDLK